jgi:hypothetical protein
MIVEDIIKKKPGDEAGQLPNHLAVTGRWLQLVDRRLLLVMVISEAEKWRQFYRLPCPSLPSSSEVC